KKRHMHASSMHVAHYKTSYFPLHANHASDRIKESSHSPYLTLSTLFFHSFQFFKLTQLRNLKTLTIHITSLYIFLYLAYYFCIMLAMATAAFSSLLQPEKQQTSSGEAIPTPSSSSAWQSSGSIGPFFAVIVILTILAVLSCYLSRMCRRRELTPLESIKGRGCFGWVKRRCRNCMARDLEVGGVGAKVMVCDQEEEIDSKVKDIDVQI
ncbi:hypothetical protein KIW84_010692, partial [Lathyrus oleraceus]